MSINPLAGIAGSVMDGLDDLFTSDEERANARLKMTEALQKPHVLQAMANIESAKHKSVFVAGWRPAIGWVCAIGLGYQFLISTLCWTHQRIHRFTSRTSCYRIR